MAFTRRGILPSCPLPSLPPPPLRDQAAAAAGDRGGGGKIAGSCLPRWPRPTATNAINCNALQIASPSPAAEP